MAVTDRQALKAARLLLEYYETLSKQYVLNEFIHGMTSRLNNEIERLSAKVEKKKATP